MSIKKLISRSLLFLIKNEYLKMAHGQQMMWLLCKSVIIMKFQILLLYLV